MKQKISETDLVNLWMTKIFNVKLEDEMSLFPERFTKSSWYTYYPVTQKQHDDWELEAKALIRQKLKLTKRYVDKYWGLTYLNTSPYVIKETNLNS